MNEDSGMYVVRVRTKTMEYYFPFSEVPENALEQISQDYAKEGYYVAEETRMTTGELQSVCLNSIAGGDFGVTQISSGYCGFVIPRKDVVHDA